MAVVAVIVSLAAGQAQPSTRIGDVDFGPDAGFDLESLLLEAQQTVFPDAARPSRIVLPIVSR